MFSGGNKTIKATRATVWGSISAKPEGLAEVLEAQGETEVGREMATLVEAYGKSEQDLRRLADGVGRMTGEQFIAFSGRLGAALAKRGIQQFAPSQVVVAKLEKKLLERRSLSDPQRSSPGKSRVDDQQLAEALERYGGNRTKAGREVGLHPSSVKERVVRAQPESPLHRFKEMRGYGSGRPKKVDDGILAALLEQHQGNRRKVAKEAGLSRSTIDLRIRQAEPNSPLAPFREISWIRVSLVDDAALFVALKKHRGNYSRVGREVGLSATSVRRRVMEADPDSPLVFYQGVRRISPGGGKKALIEDMTLAEVLERCGGNRSQAARELGVSASAINKRVRNASPDSPLKRFQEIKAQNRPRVDDATLAQVLDRYGGNRTMAAEEVGLGISGVSHRIKNAKPDSPLYRFQEVWGKKGPSPRVDDITLAKALEQHQGSRKRAAGEVGLHMSSVRKRIRSAKEGSPLLPFREIKGKRGRTPKTAPIPRPKPPRERTAKPKKTKGAFAAGAVSEKRACRSSF